jgi:hypothetical protein
MERESSSPESMIYSLTNSFFSFLVPNKEASDKKGKYLFAVHRAPRGLKACIQCGAAWLPKGIVYDIQSLPQ